MCYSNCPFEDWHGNCRNYKMHGKHPAHCYEPEEEQEKDDDE